MEWIANSDESLHKMLGDLRELFRQHKYLKVKSSAGTNRTLNQNAIMHAWYTQMALEDRQHSLQEHVRYCKWTHGVPIRCAADPDYREFCRVVLGPLPYAARLVAMDHFPVTRDMTKEQESAYLTAMQEDYATRGVKLEFPARPTRWTTSTKQAAR